MKKKESRNNKLPKDSNEPGIYFRVLFYNFYFLFYLFIFFDKIESFF